MSYSQLSDIQNLVPADILVQLTDDAGSGAVNAAIVTDCIAEADNIIDAWVGARYQLPLSPAPPLITYISVAIAVHRLFGRKVEKVPDVHENRYKDAQAQLQGISTGKITLGVQPQPALVEEPASISAAGYAGFYIQPQNNDYAITNWQAIQLSTPQHAPDSATGAGSASVAASISVSDSAQAMDAATAGQPVINYDGAAGDDSQAVMSATAPSSDAARMVEAVSIAVSIIAPDQTTGADITATGNNAPAVSDSAQDADAVLVAGNLTVADSASGSDAIIFHAPVSAFQARDASRITPAYLVQITLNGGGPTLYFSDRNINVAGQIYEDYLKDLSGIGNEVLRATSAGRNTDITLTFKNDKFQGYDYLIQVGDSYPFEAAVCRIYEIYLDDSGLASQQALLFKGVLDQPQDIDLFIFKCKVSMMPFLMDKRWKQTLVTLTNYPNVYEDTGKYLPIVYGQGVLLPAVRTNWGARTTLASASTSGQATLELSDASRFPASGSICIDQETISYTSIYQNNLNGLTRGANGTTAQPHGAGADVWQYQSVYDSIIAAHALSGITYIFAEYQGKLWLVTSGVTSQVDANGFTHLQFSDVIYVNGVLDYIGLDNTLSITDPGHSHSAAASNNYVPNYATLSFPSGGFWSGAATSVYDQVSDAGASAAWSNGGTATITADFPAYAGPPPTAVYLCITHQSGGGNAPTINGHALDNSGNTVTQKINIGTTVPPYLQPQKSATSSNYSGCYWNVYEIWLEIETASTGTAATGISQSGAVSKTGAAMATHMIERLHALVDGYADDANGTYTGTPGAVIQTPDAIIKHFLCVASGGVFNVTNDIDMPSFSAAASSCAGYVPGGYKMAFVIDGPVKPSQWAQKLAFECRSVLTYDAGQWHLNPIPDSAPAPIRTISQTDLAGKNAMFKFSKTDWKNIWNDISVSYARLYSRVNLHNSDWLGSLEVSDPSSQFLYGLMPKTDLRFETIRDQATAQNVLNHILLEMKVPHLIVEFPVFWENFDLTVGQTITISNDLYGGKPFFIQNITRKDQMTAVIKAVGWG